jgi:histidinol-phosphatase (PHP family)
VYIHDAHIHSKYSFDGDKKGGGEIDIIAETAIERHIDEISICDHCDIDGVLEGIYPPYPKNEIAEAISAAKEKYSGRLKINYGIELGQPHTREREARKLLDECTFDFVLGSLHNLSGYPDFCFLKYEKMQPSHIDLLVKRSISEQCEIACFPGISSLAHITYIGRYLNQSGINYDFMRYEDDWRKLFHILIENGIALEINTSGLRRGSITMPGRELIALYKDCGGKKFTLGSDAHTACDIGANFDEAFELI